jgi:tetratricopeptide (TPR) repeat protein
VARGEVKNGLPDYDRAIELDPRYALAYANRGWARLLLGDGLGAEKDFKKCFELDDALRIKFEPLISKQRRLLAEKQR